MQDQVRQYLRDEYAAFPPYKYVHIGFTDGAPREPFAYPPSTPRIFEHDFGPLTSSSFPGWGKPPHNVYAMWKYAQAGLADPATVFEQASGLIGSTPSDSYLQAFPHVHNAYIAGYVGYVELAKMAGRPYATQQQELDRLLQLRAQTFRWDVQANTGSCAERSILLYPDYRLEFHVSGPGTGGLSASERPGEGPGSRRSIHPHGALLDGRAQRRGAARERHHSAPPDPRPVPGQGPDSPSVPRRIGQGPGHARGSRRRSFLPPESHRHPRSLSDEFRAARGVCGPKQSDVCSH